MIVYPAIDIKDGKCVRLYKGDMEAVTVFNESPVEQARVFASEGFKWLHVVDLDGAVSAKPVNVEPVTEIIKNKKLKVQIGGGVRNMDTIDFWLSLGAERVILGTAAVRYPELVKLACRIHPGKIAVGIDARAGKVATEGWVQDSQIDAVEFAKFFQDTGVVAIIYTDIDKDGTLEGPSYDQTLKIAEAVSIPVILSGGISSTEDILMLAEARYSRISGVIAGRAIYEGKVDVKRVAGLSRA